MYRLDYTRKKTGIQVVVPVPKAVAEEIIQAGTLSDSPVYLFQRLGGEGESSGSKRRWVDWFSKAFKAAEQPGGHSHQLRDAYAVDLLVKGLALPEVAKALGHASTRTTEVYYAPWTKARQDRLDTLIMETWAYRTLTCFEMVNRSSTRSGIRRQRLRRLCMVSGLPRSTTPATCSNNLVTVLVLTLRTAATWSGLRYSVGVGLVTFILGQYPSARQKPDCGP